MGTLVSLTCISGPLVVFFAARRLLATAELGRRFGGLPLAGQLRTDATGTNGDAIAGGPVSVAAIWENVFPNAKLCLGPSCSARYI
uniref:Putative secreted protein n=1 Tax=Anopheles darlingi TaxID=43151 RepID=A0A2M4DM35_ANODA